MKNSSSTIRTALLTFAWLLAPGLILFCFVDRLYSLSPDIGHHGVLVSYLMDSWRVVPDSTLGYMAGYPRLAHLIASIPGVASGSSLIGMQVTAILAIFICWACIGFLLFGEQTVASCRLVGSLSLVLILNGVLFGVETFGHEIIANYFFGHLVAQALAIALLCIALSSEWKRRTPFRAYAVMALGGPLLTATHLVPAAELIATLGLLVALEIPEGWSSRDGRRRILVGLAALLASCTFSVIQPAFHTMVWASANDGLTVLKYVPDVVHAIGLALAVAVTSMALLLSWWRRRHDALRSTLVLKYLGAFGLSTSGICLLQAVLLVALGLGSNYAVLKYMISLQSLILINGVVLANLFWRGGDRRIVSPWTWLLVPAFGALATLAALLPAAAFSTDPIVAAEHDARAFARSSARASEKGQSIAVGMTQVPNMGSYLISRSALRAWDEPMLFDILIGKMPTSTDAVSHVLTSPGSVPWDVVRCRRQLSGALVVLDAKCLFDSFSRLPCSGTIDFSAPLPLDRNVTGFGNAESVGRWTEKTESTMRCTIGDQPPSRMYVRTSGLVTPQHRQHVEFKVNSGTALTVEYSTQSPTRVVSLEIPRDSGPELVLYIATPDAISPKQLGINIDTRTLGVMVHDIRFE